MKRLLLTTSILLAFGFNVVANSEWLADVAVAWNEAQFATGYHVHVQGETEAFETVHQAGNALTYKVIGLQAGDLYTIQVRGVNSWGEGPLSDPVQVDLRKPGKPNNNRIIDVSGYKDTGLFDRGVSQ